MFDVAIVGGGVIGCAILNKLTSLGTSAVLLERGSDVATGASKANSGLIHAGFDANPGTLKAKLNLEGNLLYPQLCKRLNLPIKWVGSVVAGIDPDVVNTLYERGITGGVTGLKILNQNEVRHLVPNISNEVTCALHAKNSGIISPYMLTVALAEEAIINGAKIMLNFEVTKIQNKKDVFNIYSKNNEFIEAKYVINSCGAQYNEIAKLLNCEQYPITYRRGEYFLLDSSARDLVPLTVFPLPSKLGKGILVTPTIDGNILVGPTSQSSDDLPITTKDGLDSIICSAGELIKNIPFNKVIREFSGIRVICGDDFIIEKSKLIKNVINLAGICSPGLSSAPAIANMVAELLNLNYKPIEMKQRKAIQQISDLPQKQIDELIKTDSNYGKIVCKCEKISLAEVIEAINSPLKPTSFDAIKRRVRVGMGKCQGGFCFLKVIEAIAKEQNIKLDDVLKENSGSNFIVGNIGEE